MHGILLQRGETRRKMLEPGHFWRCNRKLVYKSHEFKKAYYQPELFTSVYIPITSPDNLKESPFRSLSQRLIHRPSLKNLPRLVNFLTEYPAWMKDAKLGGAPPPQKLTSRFAACSFQ
jgi:hypothetical protein